MKKRLIAFITAAFLAIAPQITLAAVTFPINGGTGSTTLSGILIGNGTSPVNTLTIGSNLNLTGTTLSATGGGGGSGTVSTSSAETANYIPYWTTTAQTPAKLSGGVSSFQWNPLTNTLTATEASTTNVSASGNIYDSALSSGDCVQAGAGGVLTTTAGACGSGGGGGAWPFTPGTNFSTSTQATTTMPQYIEGIQASSTSQILNANYWGNIVLEKGGNAGSPTLSFGGTAGLYDSGNGTLGLSGGSTGIQYDGNEIYPITTNITSLGTSANAWSALYISTSTALTDNSQSYTQLQNPSATTPYTILDIAAPAANPTESDVTETNALTTGSRFVDWDSENYSNESLTNITEGVSGGGTFNPFAIRFCNLNGGGICAGQSVYSMYAFANGTDAFGVQATSSVDQTALVQIAASTTAATDLEVGNTGNAIFTVQGSGATTTNLTATGVVYGATGSAANPSIQVADGTGLYSAGGTSLALGASSANIQWDGGELFPGSNNTKNLGINSTNIWNHIYANYASTTAWSITSTSTGSAGINLSGGCFAIAGTCITSSGSGGTGNVATSSAETANYIPWWTSTNGTPAGLSGGSSSFQWVNPGLLDLASTTIGTGAQAGGLTISGGATTTGNAYFASNIGVGIQSPTANLTVQGSGNSYGGTLPLKVTNSSSALIFSMTGDGRVSVGSQSGQNMPFFVNQSGAFSGGTYDIGMADTNGTLSLNSAATVASGANYSFGANTFGSAIDLQAPAGNGMIFNKGANTGIGFQSIGVNPSATLEVYNASSTAGTTQLLVQGGAAAADAGTNNLFRVNQGGGTTGLFVIQGSGNTGIGTTSPGSLLSLNGIANFTTATSTFYGNGLNLTAGCYAIQGTCIGGGGGSGTVTSIASASGIIGGTITTSGTLSLVNWLATSSSETDGQIPYWTTSSGWPARLASVATTSLGVTGPITFSGIMGAQIGGAGGNFGCTMASNGVTGCMSATDWSYLHTATTTFSSPLSYSVATNAVTCPTCNTSSLSGSGTNGMMTAWSSTNSLIATSTILGQYFIATSSTATSTLAGQLQVGSNSLFPDLLVGSTTPVYGYNYHDEISMVGSLNDYVDANVSNNSSGACATADWVAQNDKATTADNFADFGHTSYGFTGSGCANNPFTGFGGDSTYIFDPDGAMDFAVGSTTNNNAKFNWFAGGYATGNEVMSLSTSTFAVNNKYGNNVLNLSTASSTNNNPIFQILGTSTPGTLFQVDQYGHLMASSTPATPSVSSCGTGSPVLTAGSNDVTGDVTTGTAATSCTITFGSPYSATPEVFITGGSAASVTAVTARSTTAFTVGLGTAATGDDISYFVIMP